MTLDEYKLKQKQLDIEHQSRRAKLMKEFVISNNKYKISDKITDHIGTIIFEELKFDWGFAGGAPCAIYFGKELKKDGTLKKGEPKREVYQTNIIK